MIGLRFTKLIVVKFHSNINRQKYWVCLCDCGKETIVSTRNLNSKNTKSCGCLRSEKCIERSTIHGFRHTAEYRAWRHMMGRCKNTNNPHYNDYGGRGIIVCESWKSFKNFFQDVGSRPSNDYSLDRIDCNGNYEPSNVRWATRKIQANNRRSSIILEHNGEFHSIEEWAKIKNINSTTLRNRYHNNWSVDKILNTPTNTDYKYIVPDVEKYKVYRFYARKKLKCNKQEDNLTFDEWIDIIKENDNKCFYCKMEKKLTIDHIIPLSKGGFDTKNNVVPACISCNSSKNIFEKPKLINDRNRGKGPSNGN